MARKQFSLRIEEELLKELKFLSIKEDISISSEIEELLLYGMYVDHIIRHGKKFESIEFHQFLNNKHEFYKGDTYIRSEK